MASRGAFEESMLVWRTTVVRYGGLCSRMFVGVFTCLGCSNGLGEKLSPFPPTVVPEVVKLVKDRDWFQTS